MAVVEVAILFVVMERQMPKLIDKKFTGAIWRMAAATLVTGVVCYGAVLMLPFRELDNSFYSAFPRFVAIVLISFVAYGIMSKLLRLQEIEPVLDRIKRLVSRLDVGR